MNNKTFFSVVIPTCNRPNFLKTAVKSILLQDFKDYEIVVSDNSPTDESERICLSMSDKRIRYHRNKKNIGFAKNLYQVIKMAEGQYVFMLGDDDFILKTDTLSNLHKVIKKNNFGYVRLNAFYHKNLEFLFDLGRLDRLKNKTLAPNSSNLETVNFIYNTNFTYISGIVFRNSKNVHIAELEKPQLPNFQMEHFWIKFIFKPARKYGGYMDVEDAIISRFYIVIDPKFIINANPNLYIVENNRIYLEKVWDLIFADLTEKEKTTWTKNRVEQIVTLLPSIKYYSSNRNLLLFIRRMLELNKGLYLDPFLYLSTIIALLMPKFLWTKLRNLYHRLSMVDVKRVKRVNIDISSLKAKLDINYDLNL